MKIINGLIQLFDRRKEKEYMSSSHIDIPIEMVKIDGGSFIMGEGPGAEQN